MWGGNLLVRTTARPSYPNLTKFIKNGGDPKKNRPKIFLAEKCFGRKIVRLKKCSVKSFFGRKFFRPKKFSACVHRVFLYVTRVDVQLYNMWLCEKYCLLKSYSKMTCNIGGGKTNLENFDTGGLYSSLHCNAYNALLCYYPTKRSDDRCDRRCDDNCYIRFPNDGVCHRESSI